jgi:hypothetical protein
MQSDLTVISGHRNLLDVARSAERRKAGGFGEHHFWVTRSGFGSGRCTLGGKAWFGMQDAGYGGRPEGEPLFLSESLFFGIAGLMVCGGLVS